MPEETAVLVVISTHARGLLRPIHTKVFLVFIVISYDVLQTGAVVLLQESLDLALLRGAERGLVQRQKHLSKPTSDKQTSKGKEMDHVRSRA